MRGAPRLIVVLVAVVEAAFVGFFALGAFSGDALGRSIATGVALLIAGPFLVLTLPALILALRDRRPWAAVALAAASLVAMATLWHMA